MLSCGRAGVELGLAAADRLSAGDLDAAKGLKTAAKRLAYNVAANCWPGWGDEGVEITPEHIEQGLALADQSLKLVQTLELGDHQLGTGYWLVGALQFAAGRDAKADDAFERARQAFDAAGETAESLMARGYRALAAKRNSILHDRAVQDLEEIVAVLAKVGSDDAKFFIDQLHTADRNLNRSVSTSPS